MIHNRYFPAIEGDGTDSLDELVTMSGYDGEAGRCFTGTATLELFDSPVEELTRLAPQEMIAGYWRELATSWRAGTTLERDRQPVQSGPDRSGAGG
jgi:hypothetical protein